jgi:hypothetical protein
MVNMRSNEPLHLKINAIALIDFLAGELQSDSDAWSLGTQGVPSVKWLFFLSEKIAT